MSQFQSAEATRADYGNPLIALIRAEARTCKGCVWAIGQTEFFDESVCAKDRLMRKRCKQYVNSDSYRQHWRSRNAEQAS
ncbi:hypothetical protein LMG28688_00791 [Paraburkholderia caffeinitolerans]|uniref:Uncharacterized protein n=1 Tax=Paraburkholderia caffeinitolerans TaxID=1723730 RepID=A0A6J5FFM1_9BURK|nr:hypothetical protein [Paraburkholderia caffeinitolerans]CAB3779287.1 hypothetical protein LMG28688_00791 [Paraburkholderia caffeinitolerans]